MGRWLILALDKIPDLITAAQQYVEITEHLETLFFESAYVRSFNRIFQRFFFLKKKGMEIPVVSITSTEATDLRGRGQLPFTRF